MQKLKFVGHNAGVSKKGNEYDMTEVSDGISSFVLSNSKEASAQIVKAGFKLHDEFMAEVHVSTAFGSLRGTIMKIQ